MSRMQAQPDRPCVLVVEDEPKIANLLEQYLQAHGGYRTRTLHRGDEVLASCRTDPPDLILLDLMLPGLDGIEVCKRLRSESSVPIIMVTARVDEIDRLLGLELGADDYICKPFSPREVVARVKAVLRRTVDSTLQPIEEDLSIDHQRHRAILSGKSLDLTPVEFALLAALQKRPGHILSREQLMDRMYADYRVVGDRAVDTHVKNLRRKLAAAAPGRELIESVYGLGYRYAP